MYDLTPINDLRNFIETVPVIEDRNLQYLIKGNTKLFDFVKHFHLFESIGVSKIIQRGGSREFSLSVTNQTKFESWLKSPINESNSANTVYLPQTAHSRVNFFAARREDSTCETKESLDKQYEETTSEYNKLHFEYHCEYKHALSLMPEESLKKLATLTESLKQLYFQLSMCLKLFDENRIQPGNRKYLYIQYCMLDLSDNLLLIQKVADAIQYLHGEAIKTSQELRFTTDKHNGMTYYYDLYAKNKTSLENVISLSDDMKGLNDQCLQHADHLRSLLDYINSQEELGELKVLFQTTFISQLETLCAIGESLNHCISSLEMDIQQNRNVRP